MNVSWRWHAFKHDNARFRGSIDFLSQRSERSMSQGRLIKNICETIVASNGWVRCNCDPECDELLEVRRAHRWRSRMEVATRGGQALRSSYGRQPAILECLWLIPTTVKRSPYESDMTGWLHCVADRTVWLSRPTDRPCCRAICSNSDRKTIIVVGLLAYSRLRAAAQGKGHPRVYVLVSSTWAHV